MKHHQNPIYLLTVIATVLSAVNPTLATDLDLTKVESDSNLNQTELSLINEESNFPSGEVLGANLEPINLNFPTQEGLDPMTNHDSQSQPPLIAQTPTNPNLVNTSSPAPQPEVLFPNPQITIDGRPAPTASPIQPVAPVPPFLPRAVAPPVGDIAVSNIDSSPSYIDLGTAARVPRLVLREAPVQEVLNLLARAADLNVVYTSAAAEGATAGATSSTITLDLENESVQDVFNSVLIVSGLQATRRGRTIFIGAALPAQARDLVTRSFRLNQVKVEDAQTFLASLTGEGGEGSEPLLAGLQVVGDPRLNAITLIGEPRQIEIASKFLVQLDARQRQVAVNVKIVDVNLLNTENVNTSFSFGVGDNFFTVNNGALAGNFGTFRPASSVYGADGIISPGVIPNPLSAVQTFIKPELEFLPAAGFLAFPLGAGEDPELEFFDSLFTNDPSIPPIGLLRRIDSAELTTNPLDVRITEIGSDGATTISLPNFIQYPSRFLASLNTQITNGSAKILTDPTLVVQAGQTANVNLTQEVFGGFEIQYIDINGVSTPIQRPIIKPAGLQLGVNVEKIDDNGFVTLQVNPVVSSPGNDVPTSQGPITLIQSRTLSSGSVRMRDGQTLILAGIIQESDRASVTKVPILGDIPILGALFRSTSTTRQRNEVIVLVTPQIIDDSEQAGWGYNYLPGQEAREMLEDRGFYVPTPNF